MKPIINIHPLSSEEKAESFRLTLNDADKFGLYCCSDGKSELWSVIPKVALQLIFNAETGLPVTERPWIGLTDEEIKDCFKITPDQHLPWHIYQRIEAKLKEKNT